MLTNIEKYDTHPTYSVSEHRSLSRCSQQHAYAYRQGLVPKSTPSYLTRGIYVHELLATWLTTLKDGEEIDWAVAHVAALAEAQSRGADVSPETEPELRPWLKLITQFADKVGTDFTVLEVEEEFYADLYLGYHEDVGELDLEFKPVLLHGVIDAVIRMDGDLWVVEHKTLSRAWTGPRLSLDIQGPAYVEAVAALLGERPVGVIYNFFYPKSFSQSQVVVSEDEGRNVLAELQAGIDLRYADLSPLRSEVWGCNGCQFRDLCVAELKGIDEGFLREFHYDVDESKMERFYND